MDKIFLLDRGENMKRWRKSNIIKNSKKEGEILNGKYYINTKFKNNKEFDKFVKKIKSRSIYNYKVDVSGNDKILTLSSCIGTKGKRVVLHAKLIEEN